MGSINGATCKMEDHSNPHPSMIVHDESYDFTFLNLRQHNKGGQEFFEISNAHHDKKSFENFCAHEMSERISQGVASSQSGPASGFM